MKKSEVDSGKRAGIPADVADKVKAWEREVRELRQANEDLRKASTYFAGQRSGHSRFRAAGRGWLYAWRHGEWSCGWRCAQGKQSRQWFLVTDHQIVPKDREKESTALSVIPEQCQPRRRTRISRHASTYFTEKKRRSFPSNL